jgi:hypothetical protein
MWNQLKLRIQLCSLMHAEMIQEDIECLLLARQKYRIIYCIRLSYQGDLRKAEIIQCEVDHNSENDAAYTIQRNT